MNGPSEKIRLFQIESTYEGFIITQIKNTRQQDMTELRINKI